MDIEIIQEIESRSDVYTGPGPTPKYNPNNPEGWEVKDDIQDDRPYNEVRAMIHEMQRLQAKASKIVGQRFER